MSFQLFFDAVFLTRDQWRPDAVLDTLTAVLADVLAMPHLDLDADWYHLDASGDHLDDVTLSVARNAPGSWVMMVDDTDFDGPVDGMPGAGEQEFLSVVTAVLERAPCYLGTSVWPIGPSAPEVYDQSKPFSMAQVGTVMYLRHDYLEDHPGCPTPGEAPVWRTEEVGDGVLLVADPDLLWSADDGDLDELRTYFGLQPVGSQD